MAAKKGKSILIFFGLTAAIAGGFFGIRYFINVRKKKKEEQTTPENPPLGGSVPPATSPEKNSNANTPPPPASPPPASPSSSTSTSGFKKGQDIWVNKNSVIIYTYPASGANYIARVKTINLLGQVVDGDIAQFNLSMKSLGKFVEPATSGWSKILVSQPYGKSIGGYFYVPTKDIKSTPY